MNSLTGVDRVAGAIPPDNTDALGLFLRKIRPLLAVERS